MRRLLPLFPVALMVAVALAACGADDGGDFNEVTRSSAESAGFDMADSPAFDGAAPEEEASLLESGNDAFDFAEEQVAPAADAAAAVAPEPAPPSAPSPRDGGGGDAALQISERRVISTGFVRMEVEAIQSAVDQIQLTAESLGGFVENLSIDGDDAEGFAEMTIRVPQDEFFTALERIRRLGDVESENLAAQDVTEQFIDLEARLTSAVWEEDSLLALLEEARSVSDVLMIERELTRIRSEIERLQGQLNFLERRVSLATLSLSLFTPSAIRTDPPSASYGVDVGDVSEAISRVEEVAASFDGLVASSVISIDDGAATGFVAVRVPRDDFVRAILAVEDLGDVRSKQVRTGELSDDPAAAFGEEPDAWIEVRLREDDDGTDAGIIAAIVVPSVFVGLLVIVGAFWIGRRGRGGPARPAETRVAAPGDANAEASGGEDENA